MTRRLPPDILNEEREKMQLTPARVCVTHAKPQYIRQIRKETAAIGEKTG